MRKTKPAVLVALVFLAILMLGILACSESEENGELVYTLEETQAISENKVDSPAPQTSLAAEEGWVEVVYFHRAQRCNSCIYAEEQTRYTIETYFGDELASGALIFKSINLQDDANAEMIEKYDAHSSSLFINEVKNDNENIQGIADIWTKINRDQAFTQVVKTRIEESLGNI